MGDFPDPYKSDLPEYYRTFKREWDKCVNVVNTTYQETEELQLL